ncbi:MAG: RagB/SusD family nutrient uptake outer membrane protein, partial [Bacteroidaceae bacterium]|nr:RagB/SusD family nutrient uptake outer membrane protein [Bacteroidaceae bacterium]
ARAYFYFTLVRQYGAVPFKTVNTNGAEESALPCTSSDDIFNFINDECDAIKDSIVADYVALSKTAPIDGVKSQTGRANRCAVLALKAQAALYHASPLFSQGKTAEQKTELWRKAALANKELIEACEAAGKGLAVSLDTLWTPSYITDVQADKEIIFARRTAVANTLEANNFPVGYSSGQGGNCPTQDLVDAFECTDGKSIAESPLYDPQNPYENRDPRLKKTVAVNGELWPSDLEAYNSAYPTLQTYEGGYHSRTGAAAGASYATPTGYYLKKLCNGNQILRARSGKAVTTSAHGWMTFRMGGMYLNYAEAVFQYFKSKGLDNAADAVDATFTKSARALASMTRQRSNMPQFPVGLSNAEFWAKYKNERRVELAFEGHRFYDVRRWMEDGDKFMVVHAANITLDGDGNLVFGTPKTIVRGGGTWQEKWNLFPFSQSEILKSKNAIKQNEGW